MKVALKSIGVFGLILGLVVWGMAGGLPHVHDSDSVHRDCLLCRTPVIGMGLVTVSVALHLTAARSGVVFPITDVLSKQTTPLLFQERAPPAFSSIV